MVEIRAHNLASGNARAHGRTSEHVGDHVVREDKKGSVLKFGCGKQNKEADKRQLDDVVLGSSSPRSFTMA